MLPHIFYPQGILVGHPYSYTFAYQVSELREISDHVFAVVFDFLEEWITPKVENSQIGQFLEDFSNYSWILNSIIAQI